MSITLDALKRLDRRGLHEVLCAGHPLDPKALENARYRGIDLSLPAALHRLLWETFVKAFVRDEKTGEIRGWNVRIEQTGHEGPIRALRDRVGKERTFGHYVLRERGERRFPWGWRGAHFLDYRCAGNLPLDVARFATAPLVAVNAGDMELLLGWEIVHLGPLAVPLPDYWALVRLGPCAPDEIAPVPRPAARRRSLPPT